MSRRVFHGVTGSGTNWPSDHWRPLVSTTVTVICKPGIAAPSAATDLEAVATVALRRKT